ncbi:dihydrofolate reductase [Geodermatophilus sp. URMC 64]
MQSTVRLVWAQDAAGIIGADGALPWHLPEDLRLFRALTLGSTVVMGRRTWLSLPPRVRPLPGRRNVVLSTTLTDADAGVPVATSVGEVLAAHDELWVIGGGGVYTAFLPHAAEVVVTEVDGRFPGDTWAPRLDGDWEPAMRVPAEGWLPSSGGLRFAVTWWRREAGAGSAGSPVPGALTRWRADVVGRAESAARGR